MKDINDLDVGLYGYVVKLFEEGKWK